MRSQVAWLTAISPGAPVRQQARGGVERVADGRSRALGTNDHLARRDPGPHAQLVAHCEGRAHGPLRVILLSLRGSEDGEDRISAEHRDLLDLPAVLIDQCAHTFVGGRLLEEDSRDDAAIGRVTGCILAAGANRTRAVDPARVRIAADRAHRGSPCPLLVAEGVARLLPGRLAHDDLPRQGERLMQDGGIE